MSNGNTDTNQDAANGVPAHPSHWGDVVATHMHALAYRMARDWAQEVKKEKERQETKRWLVSKAQELCGMFNVEAMSEAWLDENFHF